MPTRLLRPLRGALTAVALATVSLASFAFAATADANAPKPTVVLVHGAFADASGFAAVIDRLRDDGYPVRAAPNPLLGLQEDAATVRGFLDSIKGPKIVVGPLLRRRRDHAGRQRRPRRQGSRLPRRARPR
jgi:hypothetical protein